MADLSVQDAYLLDKVVDPASKEFAHLMNLLLTNPAETDGTPNVISKKGEFRYTLPYRGDLEEESLVREYTPFKFADRGEFRNGISSLSLSLADLLDLVQISSSRKRNSATVVVTTEYETLSDVLLSAGPIPSLVFLSPPQSMLDMSLQVSPEVLIFDHTTVCTPIDDLLNVAYRLGVKVVDGVFPYHVAALRGWDVVSGMGKWTYTHDGTSLSVGPADDTSRMIRYNRTDYSKFVDPNKWNGNARKYGYELRKAQGGLVTYRAVYLGDDAYQMWDDKLSYNLPVCSSEDMVLVTLNRSLAAGVFVSKSNNAQDLARLEKNYAIEVRRDLFVSTVDYLISMDAKSDIVGEAVRYITNHNYVDLVEGVRVIRCASLSYADALCVAMVCALTAFQLRYRLTSESLYDIRKQVATAQELTAPTFGSLERIVWFMVDYVTTAVRKVVMRSLVNAKHALRTSDFIPGVCYDIYMTTQYSPELEWFEPSLLALEPVAPDYSDGDYETDPLTAFIAEASKASAPTAVRVVEVEDDHMPMGEHSYTPNLINDPVSKIQDVYDHALPGNSTAQLQNVAELRKVRDIDFHTEFYGRVEVNKDAVNNERLHDDATIRTAALPVMRTSLVDAILASAKRNFNPPDLQMENDPWEFARYLVNKFKTFAFTDFADPLLKSYQKHPLTFNVTDYIEWRATRDTAYRSALEAECDQGMVELGLERFDTIVKRRIKPKLSVSAQHELAQPQVIVSNSKKDTAPFTSVFRKMFERFEALLLPEFASAGRMSDDDISNWATKNSSALSSCAVIEIDSSKYDKSQGLLARMIESLLLQDLGMDPKVLEIFEDSYVGKVSSRTLGLMFISAYQMKSGAPQTMLGNVIYNFVSAMECIGPDNIRRFIAKGDDNLAWLNEGVNLPRVVHKMSSLFNLEVKLITNSPWYFSSGYLVQLDGGVVKFAPDPLKTAELLGERGHDQTTVHERFVSFRDRVSSYTAHHSLPHKLTAMVRLRVKVWDLDVVGLIDAFAALASDEALYARAATQFS